MERPHTICTHTLQRASLEMRIPITKEEVDVIYSTKWLSVEDKDAKLYSIFIHLTNSFIKEEIILTKYVEDLLDSL